MLLQQDLKRIFIYSQNISTSPAGSIASFSLVDGSPSSDAVPSGNWRVTPSMAVSTWKCVSRKLCRKAFPTGKLRPSPKFSVRLLVNSLSVAHEVWTMDLISETFAASFSCNPTPTHGHYRVTPKCTYSLPSFLRVHLSKRPLWPRNMCYSLSGS